MALKYHDSFAEQVRDGNGELMDNWDPDKDYGGEYAYVFLQMMAYSSYSDIPSGMPGHESTLYAEPLLRLVALGFTLEQPTYNLGYVSARRGYEYLQLGATIGTAKGMIGVVKKNTIRELARVLGQGWTFELRQVVLYDTRREMTDDEFQAEVAAHKAEFRQDILSACRNTSTKRIRMFIAESVAEDIAKKHILRVPDTKADTQWCTRYIEQTVIPELVKEGLLISRTDQYNRLLVRCK